MRKVAETLVTIVNMTIPNVSHRLFHPCNMHLSLHNPCITSLIDGNLIRYKP